jgi:phosphomevalonate kinase
MLADVDAGSDTPSLVGKVLKWRKAESTQGQPSYPGLCLNQRHLSLMSDDLADALWTALNKSNQELAKTLLSLCDMYERDQISYTDAVKFISSLQHVQVSLCSRTMLI